MARNPWTKAADGVGVSALIGCQLNNTTKYSEDRLRCFSQSRNGSKLHGKNFATGGHPGRWNNLVSKRRNVFHGFVVHEVCGAFHLNNCLIGRDGMMAMLEVKAEAQVSGMFDESIANRTIDNISGQSLMLFQ